MGDPAGIGAGIIVKALTNHEIYEWCRALVIGDTARLRQVAGILGLAIKITSVSTIRRNLGRLAEQGKIDPT
jgi:4-phospho-D-threonate 3-dehydrogenase / 4-phospho-D-erythronate 3-dehydrogenase